MLVKLWNFLKSSIVSIEKTVELWNVYSPWDVKFRPPSRG